MSMKNMVGLLGVWLFACSFFSGREDRIIADAFIERYALLAVDEMKRSGVPASIKLAQAMVESNMGRSTLALQSNNHFGIKCKTYWTGKQYYHKDDDFDKKGKLVESCFRAYENIQSSFKDHSDFLKYSGKYDILFSLEITDYRGWAHGLRSCGYATDKSYAIKLIQTIEEFSLYRFDTYQTSEFDIPTNTGNFVSRAIYAESTVD